MSLKEPVEPQEPCGLRRISVPTAAHQGDMIAHELAQHTAERLGPAERRKGVVRRWRCQRPPDRLALLNTILAAQHGNGIAAYRFHFDQVIEEAIDDAGTVQQRRWLPLRAPFSQPGF